MNATRDTRGFTLVELLVSITILALIVTLLSEVIVRTQNTISQATTHMTEFKEARTALDSMSFALSQAAMDACWAFQRNSEGSVTAYERASDQHFVLGQAKDLLPGNAEIGQAVFFQAPMGYAGNQSDPAQGPTATPANIERLPSLMNCWGFSVQFGSDVPERPGFLQAPTALNPERKRFRLMQYAQPAESSILYSAAFGLNKLTSESAARQWFLKDLAKYSHPIADNVLAVILVPYATNVTMTDASNGYSDTQTEPDAHYGYDSREFQWNGVSAATQSRRHQLPAKVTITLVLTDERSFDQLVIHSGDNADDAAEKVRTVFRGKFADFNQYADDLKAIEDGLHALRLHYKTLSTTIALKGGKWVTEL